jgi:hypothetical protein
MLISADTKIPFPHSLVYATYRGKRIREKTTFSGNQTKVARINGARVKREGRYPTAGKSRFSRFGELDWNARYGNLKKYKKQVAIAHRKTHKYCVVCLTKKSEEIHHAYYGNDVIGVSTFPTCYRCHDEICHSPTNWIKNPSNPVWGNRNTDEFITRLRLGYQLLYGGIRRV